MIRICLFVVVLLHGFLAGCGGSDGSARSQAIPSAGRDSYDHSGRVPLQKKRQRTGVNKTDVIQPKGKLPAKLLQMKTRRADCFPVEKLRPEHQLVANSVLEKLLDSEAIYSLVGGRNPMTFGWQLSTRSLKDYPHASLRLTSKQWAMLYPVIRSGDDVFLMAIQGADAYHYAFVNAPAFSLLAQMQSQLPGLESQKVDFSKPSLVAESLDKIQWLELDDFHKKQFFELMTKSLPMPFNHYAQNPIVDKQQEDKSTDSEKILEYYQKVRDLYLGERKAGPVALIRDWFDDGKGMCSSYEAMRKVLLKKYIHPGQVK